MKLFDHLRKADLLMGGSLKEEAHIYLAFSYKNNDPQSLSILETLLTNEESEKQKAFYRFEDQHLYLLAHGLIRIILSKYCDVDPGSWKFTYNSYGRPEVKCSGVNHILRFSLSRTKNLVAFLIVNSIDCGIDVEAIKSFKDLSLISEEIFSIQEKSMFKKLNTDEQIKKFFSIWTLKEAFTKAKGKGLSIPLNSFCFLFDDQKFIKIFEDPRANDSKPEWQFYQFMPSSLHICSIALRKKDHLKMRIFEIIHQSGGFFFLPFNINN